MQQPVTLTSPVLPVKKFHQQQQQQHVDGHPQQQQQEPQQQQQQTLPSLSPGSSRQQARQQKQYGLSRTLHALRSTGVTAAEAARASPQLLTSAITQCESLGEVLQVCVLPRFEPEGTNRLLRCGPFTCVRTGSQHEKEWDAATAAAISRALKYCSCMCCSMSMLCHRRAVLCCAGVLGDVCCLQQRACRSTGGAAAQGGCLAGYITAAAVWGQRGQLDTHTCIAIAMPRGQRRGVRGVMCVLETVPVSATVAKSHALSPLLCQTDSPSSTTHPCHSSPS